MSEYTPCPRCGKTVMYGRHIRNEECLPCLDCVRIGLSARYPCIHDLMRQHEDENKELDVWLGGLP